MSRRLDHSGTGYTTEELFGRNKLDIENPNPNPDPQAEELLIKSGERNVGPSKNKNGKDNDDDEDAEEKRKQEATRQLMDALDGDDEAIELGIDINDITDIHSTKLMHRSRQDAITARARADELYAGVEDRRIAGPNGTTVRLDERGRYRDENNNRISPQRVAQANMGNPDFADMEEARQGIFQARRAEFIQQRRERGVNGQEPGQERSARWSANEGIQITPALAKLGDAFGDAATHTGKPTPTAPAFTPDLQLQAKQTALALSPSGG